MKFRKKVICRRLVSPEQLVIAYSVRGIIYSIVLYCTFIAYALSELRSHGSKCDRVAYDVEIVIRRRSMDLRFIVRNQVNYGNGLSPLAKVIQDVTLFIFAS